MDDAIEALESSPEEDARLWPALCGFLLRNVPLNDKKMCRKVVDTLRCLVLGGNEITDTKMDKSCNRNVIKVNKQE